MPKQKNEKTNITLYPPRVEISKKTDRFNLFITVKWGEFEREIKLTKETAGLFERTIDAINVALLEASETTQPYI